jgi:hypothetical protein
MGNCGIRFKKTDDIHLKLIAQLSSKISVKDWIQIYESHSKNKS